MFARHEDSALSVFPASSRNRIQPEASMSVLYTTGTCGHRPELTERAAGLHGVAGTQAAYRGTRLFDAACPASQTMITKWVAWRGPRAARTALVLCCPASQR